MRNSGWMMWLALLWLPTAAAEGMSLQQVALTRSVNEVAAQPNGNAVAYTLSVPRVPGQGEDGPAWNELHVLDARGVSRPFLSGEVNVGAPQWLPDGGIVFLMRGAKDKTRSLYRIPVDGGGPVRLHSLETDIRSFSLSPDGKRVALLAQAPLDSKRSEQREQGFDAQVIEEEDRAVQIWLAEVQGKVEDKPLNIKGAVQELAWSPAGDRLAVQLTPHDRINDVMVNARVAIVSLQGRELATVESHGKFGAMFWSPDGAHLALVTAADAADPREGRLSVVGREGGATRDLLPGLEGHVWNLAWRDADTVVFISNEGTATRVAEVDLDGTQRTLSKLDTPVYTALSLAADGSIALVGSTPQHPPELFRLMAGNTQPQRLTHSNAWLDKVQLARQEVVRYRARDGLELEGILVHPLRRVGKKPVPLVMVVHGGPEAHFSNGWISAYAQPAQTLAARGFAVFLPNYRSSTGRGVAFSKLGQGKPGQEEFSDLIDAIEHLVASGLVDRRKVGITGASYGGYASAWGATFYSEHFAAAVAFVAITDKVGLIGTSDIPNEFHNVHYLRWPWQDWELFEQTSPLRHVMKHRTPLLILHGDADPRVDATQSRTLYRYLKQLDQAPVRLVLYPGEGHGNRRAASRWDYSLRLVRWMEHYLKGPGGNPPPHELDYQLDSFPRSRDS